jgi:Glu-tRNA(Gln) amidotransferase subunit E-like FAD-binding protein
MHPDKEIAVWERIAENYAKYTSQRELSLEAKEDIFQTLLMCSMASDEETIKSLKLKVLSQDEARKMCKEF